MFLIISNRYSLSINNEHILSLKMLKMILRFLQTIYGQYLENLCTLRNCTLRNQKTEVAVFSWGGIEKLE